MEDELDQDRITRMRGMARKLAKNRSKMRTVRKLPQTMVIVPAPRAKRAFPGRQTINRNKRLTYIVLLGAVMCAYMYDLDQDTLGQMLRVVSAEAHAHLGGLLGSI